MQLNGSLCALAFPMIVVVGVGCSSLDSEVGSAMTHAALTTDPTHGAALANLQIAVYISSGSAASHTVSLGPVFIRQPPAYAGEPEIDRLDLAVDVPTGFDPRFHNGEARTISLINTATTNAELAPYCGRVLVLNASLFIDGDFTSTYGPSADVTVACPR